MRNFKRRWRGSSARHIILALAGAGQVLKAGANGHAPPPVAAALWPIKAQICSRRPVESPKASTQMPKQFNMLTNRFDIGCD
jgi:hypothetical protein